MKAKVIALISTTIILMLSIPIAFFSGIPTIYATTEDNGDCDSSYPDTCIPSPPPDLNCGDIPNKNFKVTGNDPHGFDRDGDGRGCES